MAAPAPDPEDCTNGVDDDADGLVDCEDGDCALSAICVEDCADGVDNDLDGLADCADDECLGRCAEVTLRVLGAARVLVEIEDDGDVDFDYYGGDYDGERELRVEVGSVLGAMTLRNLAGTISSSCSWTIGSLSFGRGWSRYADYYGSGSFEELVPISRTGLSSSGGCAVSPWDHLPTQAIFTAQWAFAAMSDSTLRARSWYVAPGVGLQTTFYTHHHWEDHAGLGGGSRIRLRGELGEGAPISTTIVLP